MSRLSLGLDLSDRAAKIIVADGTTSRVGLQHATTLTKEAGNYKTFGKALRAWVRDRNLQGVPTVVSIPADKAVLRWVMLPNVEGDERRDAARFKVKRHLPFPVEEAYVEVADAPSEDDSQTPSLVIAVRREVVEQRVEAVAYADLNPAAAELEAQGILRVVERRLQERSRIWWNASLTIVDIGSDRTQMYVVQNQRLQFLRSVRFGLRQVAEALAAALDITVEEASARLASPGSSLRADGRLVIDSTTEAAVVDVSDVLDRLTRECLRLLRYFRSLYPERSYAGILDHMVLSGGAAGLRGLPEYLGQFLKLRVEPVRPFSGLSASIDAEAFRQLALSQEAYTVALGLAFSGLEGTTTLKEVKEAENQFLWQRNA